MKCSKCGSELNGSKFCPNCGNENTSNKKSNNLVAILIIVLIAVIIGVLGYFIFFKKNDNSYKKNIEVLETTMANLEKNGNESGTVKFNMALSIKNSIDLDFNGFIKYTKNNNKYDFNVGLEKSLFMDEINLYLVVTDKNMLIYIPTSIFKLIGYDVPSNTQWLKSNFNYSDLGMDNIDFESKSNTTKKEDLSKILSKNNIKYVGKSDGLKHYKIVLDKDLLNKLSENDKMSSDEIKEIEKMNLSIDLYINNNQIEKMVIDMSDAMKSQQVDVEKYIITISFEDLNKTNVVIPDEAKETTMTIDDVLGGNFDSTLSNFNLSV